jgi:hypothetical protein
LKDLVWFLSGNPELSADLSDHRRVLYVLQCQSDLLI